MFFVQNSRTIFYSDNYQDIVDKLNEYYNTVLLFNEIDLKKFLNSYKIIESKNNVIIKEFNGSVLYDLFKNNKPKIKQTVINHKFNNMKPLIEKEEENKNEYENMFNETSIIPSIVDLKKSDDTFIKLQQFLNLDINSYDINKFNDFIQYIKDVLLMEAIHNNNIELINKTINLLCNLLTNKFQDKLKDKNIKDIIILLQEKIKHFNYQITQLKKQSEDQQKFKRENLLNMYKSNLSVYNIMKENNLNLENNINSINNCDSIPENFKIMYYAYSNSSNLDDFIKAFNEYHKTVNNKNVFFKEFLL